MCKFSEVAEFLSECVYRCMKLNCDHRWNEGKGHDPCRLWSLPEPTTAHGRGRLSMNISLRPHSWLPKNEWVVFFATVCFVTGYKQQGFLGRESVLIENFHKRRIGICSTCNNLVTKATFVGESHRWIVHTEAACPLSSHCSLQLLRRTRPPRGPTPHWEAAKVMEGLWFHRESGFWGWTAFPNPPGNYKYPTTLFLHPDKHPPTVLFSPLLCWGQVGSISF